MLGTFNLPSIGSFVVSGDSPEEFLWDLFDQIVTDGTRTVNVGGIQMAVDDKSGYSQDYQERLEARGSAEWAAFHSAYFSNKVSGGLGIFIATIPPAAFFDLHKVALLGTIIQEKGSESRAGVIKTNIARSTHGVNTPEFYEATKDIKWHDYPFDDMSSISVINYMILKGILHVRSSGGIPLLTADDAKALRKKQQEEMSRLLKKQKEAALASKQRAKDQSKSVGKSKRK